MKADVYMSIPCKKILLVAAGEEFSSLPEKALEFAKSLQLHGQWEIDPMTPRFGLDQEAAIGELERKGYYAAIAKIWV